MDQVQTFAYDVLVCVCEGGINYWADIDHYSPSETTARITEFGDDEAGEGTKHTVTEETIAKAISTLKSGPVAGLCDAKRAHLIGQSYIGPDERDIDAEDADILVQVGLFGKVIYW